ncbi:MAG TPA: hypothetical protein QGF58_04070 [Myxococcota bacterium]|nr:hypothetical protein [Myxococcota bacterium]
MLLLTSLAIAAPDHVAATLDDAAGTTLSDFTPVIEEDLVGFLEEGSTELRVIDGQSFETLAAAVCSEPAGVGSWTDDSGTHFAVGCASGDVDVVLVDTDRQISVEATVELGMGAVLDVAVNGTDLWVLVDGDSGLEGYRVDTTTLEADTDSASTFSNSGVEDSVGIGSYVIVLHGNDDLSRIDATTGSVSQSTETLGGRDFVHLVVEPDSTNNLLVADAGGGLLRYQISGNDFQILLDDEQGLAETTAVQIGAIEEDWVALAESGDVWLYDYSGGVDADSSETIDVGATVRELASIEGYLFTGSDEGTVHVLTDRAWLEFTDAPTETLVTGDAADLSLTSDTAGTWTMTLGEDGDIVEMRDIEAGETATVTLEIDDAWSEGTNRVWLTLDDGHDAVDLLVDNPPPKPSVSVDWGDQAIYVDITAAGIDDLGSYEIYVSSEEFTADDFDTGGPEGTAPVSPISLTGDGDISHTITDVDNGVTYYVAVRVVDDGGTEGDMSKVHEVTPQETGGWAEAVGAPNGCAHVPLGALFLLALAGLFMAPRAEAADFEGWKTKTKTNELHVGPMEFDQAAFGTVYGDSVYMLRFDGGRQLWRFFELGGSVGLVRKEGTLVGTDSEASSGDASQLTILPLSAAVTARFDPTLKIRDGWRGMPVVPYASIGADYYLRRERYGDIDTEDPFGNEVWSGGQAGWHYALGADILLDWMDPDNASRAQARWGIEDTYLTIEWRTRQDWPSSTSSLSFAGDTVTVGLKVDRK